MLGIGYLRHPDWLTKGQSGVIHGFLLEHIGDPIFPGKQLNFSEHLMELCPLDVQLGIFEKELDAFTVKEPRHALDLNVLAQEPKSFDDPNQAILSRISALLKQRLVMLDLLLLSGLNVTLYLLHFEIQHMDSLNVSCYLFPALSNFIIDFLSLLVQLVPDRFDLHKIFDFPFLLIG